MDATVLCHIRQWTRIRIAADDIRDAAVLRIHGDQSTKSLHEAEAHASFLDVADELGYDVKLRSAERDGENQ